MLAFFAFPPFFKLDLSFRVALFTELIDDYVEI